MHPEPHDELRVASFRDLTTATLYDILRLRSDVFVVEQDCAYPDLDGRDTEPGTRHLWFSRDHEVRAYLRILDDHGVERIGRVVTAKTARGAGLAGRLMEHALEIIGSRPSVLDAQSYLVGFYARYGFAPTGPEYVEDGIPHVPMAR
ncbi:GNAT family N-acetyltransferase [Actinoplanes teichomyceticus]|uniref:ElaA protein n=1 Tax=Actinoplanes teichomyceticus TaxID=1867 RepID=A0A561WMX1_ACTTI|nr:GNAT family N-acetyltransferase [Actinoplanes teichomyceticus]TWG25200.1 ElaA protein [Actinoplanes teichomyceticus]GIF10269.1 ElaA protein [Actinoplanes teichomyceticus]